MSNEVIVDTACSGEPIRTQNNQHVYSQYIIEDWSSCSKTCGEGIQKRMVTCKRDGVSVTDEQCSGAKPANERSCSLSPCPDWIISDWTDCSTTCGPGIRHREVKYARTLNEDPLSHQYCSNDMPAATEQCLNTDCPEWVTSYWTKCLVTCGSGIRRRSVSCVYDNNPVSTSLCQLNGKPRELENCTISQLCISEQHRVFSPIGRGVVIEYDWRLGGWGECSTSCGDGIRKRLVSCRRMDTGLDVAISYCQSKKKFAAEEPCRLRACGNWRAGNWGQCNAKERCGDGVSYRQVACLLTNGVYGENNDCDSLSKPAVERPCHHSECPNEPEVVTQKTEITRTRVQNKQYTTVYKDLIPAVKLHWRVGAWTDCSVTCEGGVRRRAVECYKNAEKSSDCVITLKPDTDEACNTDPCPSWRTGGWTTCSEACGRGEQQRMVICQLHDGTRGEFSKCGENMPELTRDCFQQGCGTPVWNISTWGECSVSCGMGEMRRDIKCVDSGDNSIELLLSECSSLTKPTNTETCIQTNCTKWFSENWTECKGTCQKAVQTRNVWCSSLSKEPVHDSLCNDVKPVDEKECKKSNCGPRWVPSPWSKCSKSCGVESMRIRKTVCENGHGLKLPIERCSLLTRPYQQEVCNVPACPEWRPANWSDCSVSCGHGQTTRNVHCYNQTSNQIISSSLCDSNSRPDMITVCKQDDCPVWITRGWFKCSGPCTEAASVQHRKVSCLTAVGKEILPASRCDPKTQPRSTRPCQDCAVWRMNEWGRCSSTCGSGFQNRKVSCVSGLGMSVPESRCVEPKPSSTKSCNTGTVCASWISANWGECSVTCGHGMQSRDVRCRDNFSLRIVSDERCEAAIKPERLKPCAINECAIWATSKWSPCSTTCGDGVRQRTKQCMLNNSIVDDSLCADHKRPDSFELCSQSACHPSTYVWKSSKWSECSASCGLGVKTRRVSCYSTKSMKDVPIYFCQLTMKPKNKRNCQTRYCSLIWTTGNWSQCSTTCGPGKQSRSVICNSVSAEGWTTLKPDSTCARLTRPINEQDCNMGLCLSTSIWTTQPWSKCDAPCGLGKRRRKVRCVSTTGEKTPRQCNKLYRPAKTQTCYAGECFAKTCSELRTLSNIRANGEYQLSIRGKLIKVYCHRMSTREPLEYITLHNVDRNYAKVSEHRSKVATICPAVAGSYCSQCLPEKFKRAGRTSFSKIRINITSLTVIRDDFEFSKSEGRNKIAYGNAGDCFSTRRCPQGRFVVNLEKTGLKISSQTKWEANGGTMSHKLVHKSRNGYEVAGWCGGFCGFCAPDEKTGLLLELDSS